MNAGDLFYPATKEIPQDVEVVDLLTTTGGNQLVFIPNVSLLLLRQLNQPVYSYWHPHAVPIAHTPVRKPEGELNGN